MNGTNEESMTDVIASGPLTRYVFENPWPLGITVALAAIFVGWRGLSSGERAPRQTAAILAAAAFGVFLLATLITTAAERGEAVVRELVSRAERGETSRMLDLFSPNATMSYGRPENPGVDFNEIRAALSTLEGRFRITSNRVTQLEGNSEASGVATVLLTCLTDVEAGYGTTPNSWWLKLAEQPDGSWKIERLAFLKVAGRAADGAVWR